MFDPIKVPLSSIELKFDEVGGNSMDGVGDRDYIVEFLFWASLLSTHLRSAEELRPGTRGRYWNWVFPRY